MNVNEIAQCIMQRFYDTDSKVGYVVDERWLRFSFMESLNPKEQDFVNDAIRLLENEGLVKVEQRAGMLCLVLTQKGYDAIYNEDGETIIKRIQSDIMSKFASNKTRVGETLDYRWITLTYIQTLNPQERQYAKPAIEGLISEGYVEPRSAAIPLLVLTQKGFDKIY